MRHGTEGVGSFRARASSAALARGRSGQNTITCESPPPRWFSPALTPLNSQSPISTSKVGESVAAKQGCQETFLRVSVFKSHSKALFLLSLSTSGLRPCTLDARFKRVFEAMGGLFKLLTLFLASITHEGVSIPLNPPFLHIVPLVFL